MSRAYDDVFSESLLDLRPATTLRIHVMRDPGFAPNGVALEVAPAGVPHVVIGDPTTCGLVLVQWTLDGRSELIPHERLHIHGWAHDPAPAEIDRLLDGLGPRPWKGVVRPETVRTHDMGDEVRALFDPRCFPKDPAWRVAWPYQVDLLAPSRDFEDSVSAWLVIETP